MKSARVEWKHSSRYANQQAESLQSCRDKRETKLKGGNSKCSRIVGSDPARRAARKMALHQTYSSVIKDMHITAEKPGGNIVGRDCLVQSRADVYFRLGNRFLQPPLAAHDPALSFPTNTSGRIEKYALRC